VIHTFHVHSPRIRVQARAWLKHSRIFGRILFKFAGHILQMTASYMGYIGIMFTHRGHTHERACACAHVIKCSLIYGRFLLKCAMNIQLTTSSKGYVLFMFTHHACERAWLHIQLYLDGFSSNLMGTYYT
jgi:hypothetical protein